MNLSRACLIFHFAVLEIPLLVPLAYALQNMCPKKTESCGQGPRELHLAGHECRMGCCDVLHACCDGQAKKCACPLGTKLSDLKCVCPPTAPFSNVQGRCYSWHPEKETDKRSYMSFAGGGHRAQISAIGRLRALYTGMHAPG